MSKPIQFIVATSSHKPRKEYQKLIKSHASRGRAKQKLPPPRARSWILQRNGSPTDVEDQYTTSIPPRVGSDLSLVNFPMEIQPYMQGDLYQVLSPLREALYPPEICLQVDLFTSSWTTSLLTDLVYLHCTIFSAEAYLDLCRGKPQSLITQFHFLKTLRLLQERLYMPEDPACISDPTIMVVSILTLTAELSGDVDAAKNHMQGLRRIVDLRGGLEMLRFENSRLPAKICRVDLSVVLRFGTKPIFFSNTLSWEPFIWDRGLIKAPSGCINTNEQVSSFVKTLDAKMVNIWNDLREFSRLSNLAAQTTYKMQPNTFSEIMVSVLYRLLYLSFPDEPVLEAMRLAMAVFAAGIFFQWRGIRERLSRLDNEFRSTLQKMRGSETNAPPPILIIWLLMIQHACSSEQTGGDELAQWLHELMAQLNMRTWNEVRNAMKSVMWVDFVHNPLIERVGLPQDSISGSVNQAALQATQDAP